MEKVAKYEMGLLNKTGKWFMNLEKDKRMVKNEREELSEKSDKKFSIVKIMKMDKFDDKYEVDMMNNK